MSLIVRMSAGGSNLLTMQAGDMAGEMILGAQSRWLCSGVTKANVLNLG